MGPQPESSICRQQQRIWSLKVLLSQLGCRSEGGNKEDEQELEAYDSIQQAGESDSFRILSLLFLCSCSRICLLAGYHLLEMLLVWCHVL